jgi:hypothetical protein
MACPSVTPWDRPRAYPITHPMPIPAVHPTDMPASMSSVSTSYPPLPATLDMSSAANATST